MRVQIREPSILASYQRRGPIAVALVCRISATKSKEERAFQEGRAVHSGVRRYNIFKKQVTAWRC